MRRQYKDTYRVSRIIPTIEPAFDPENLPGLALWLKADEGVIQSQGNVSSWSDLSPMFVGNDFISSGQVIWEPETFTTTSNSPLPALVSSTGSLFNSNMQLPGEADTSEWSIVVVIETYGEETPSGIILRISDFGIFDIAVTDYEAATVGSTNLSIGLEEKVVIEAQRVGSNINVYRNGVLDSTTAGGGTLFNDTSEWLIYQSVTGVKLAEAFVTAEPLSAENRTSLMSYLNTKYVP